MKTSGVARRVRGTADSSDIISIDTVVCANCGQRFLIRSNPAATADLAEKQAAWVADQLVWDHIQERKHHGTMDIPDVLEEPAKTR